LEQSIVSTLKISRFRPSKYEKSGEKGLVYGANFSVAEIKFLTCLLAFTLVPCSAYSSTLKMEAIWSSETSVDFQQTTLRYIPGHSTRQNYCCEIFKSYIIIFQSVPFLKSCFLINPNLSLVHVSKLYFIK
jgi:hypothetical protein